MPDYLDVGEIVNTHGIKGEVRVQSLTSNPGERYAEGSKLVIKMSENNYQPITVKSHRVHKSFDLLTFEGYENINEVEQFKGKMLQVDSASRADLDEDEYYTNQIIGTDVLDEDGQKIGRLKEIMFYPANDVWVIERPEKDDLFLPNIESVVLNVDIEKEEIMVHVLEGLDTDED